MYLIVGVDPGTTTGIAAVTFEGNIYNVRSSRNMGVDQAVKYIVSLGRPSIIASDVSPVPDAVLKIASSLGCRLFTPYESLSVAVKNALTTEHKVEDLHARDALAAALNAFNKYKNKLQKIGSLGYGDEVKHKVLQGMSLEKTIAEINSKKSKPSFKKKEITSHLKPGKTVQESLKSLQVQNLFLKDQITLKESEIFQLKKEILSSQTKFREDLYRKPEFKQQEKVIESLEYQISMLKDRLKGIDQIKEMWRKLAKGQIIAVGVYPEILRNLTYIKYRISASEIEKPEEIKMAFTEDLKNREILSKQGIRATDAKKIREYENIAFIAKEDLDKLTHSPLKSLETLLDEYRVERMKKK